MTKIYMVYIKYDEKIEGIIPYLSKQYLSYTTNSGNKYIAYAYTSKKKIIEKFKETRNMKKFIIVENEYTDNEINKFEKIHYKLKLGYFDVIYGMQQKCSLLLTEHEYTYACDDGYYLEELIDCCVWDYRTFKREYIEALDILLYCSTHLGYYDEDDSTGEIISHNQSYGIYTVETNLPRGRYIRPQTNELNVLVSAFSKLFNMNF